MIFAKHPIILVSYKIRKRQKQTMTHLKFMTLFLNLKKKKTEHEVQVHKFPHWLIVSAKLTEDLHPPAPNALFTGENLA